jgi:hypothetical protein
MAVRSWSTTTDRHCRWAAGCSGSAVPCKTAMDRHPSPAKDKLYDSADRRPPPPPLTARTQKLFTQVLHGSLRRIRANVDCIRTFFFYYYNNYYYYYYYYSLILFVLKGKHNYYLVCFTLKCIRS